MILIVAVYKDKITGTWYFRVYISDPLSGRRIQKTRKGFELKRDALDAEMLFVHEYKNQRASMDNTSFEIIIDEYLKHLKKKVKITTYIGKEYQINKHIREYFKNYKIKNITINHVNEWYEKINKLKSKISSKNKLLRNFKEIASYLEQQYDYSIRSIKMLPSFRTDVIETKRMQVIYDIETFNKFIACASSSLEHALFNTLFYTGLRIGELRALKWTDIDLDNNIISVNKQITSKVPKQYSLTITPKTKESNREVIIPGNLCKILKSFKEEKQQKKYFEDDWQVFGDFGFVHETTLRRIIDRIVLEADIPRITLHGFRHSYVSMLYHNRIDPKVIQSQTGHSSVNITLDTYTHMNLEEKRKDLINVFNDKK